MKRTSHEHAEGFMTEEEIDRIFLAKQASWFKKTESDKNQILKWFKKDNDHPKVVAHHYKIGGTFDCDLLVDEWMKWTLPLPSKVNPIAMLGTGYGGMDSPENLFLFKSGRASVYFVATSPYRSSDTVRVVITEQYPILIPIYFIETSKQENPSLDTQDKLLNLIKQDLGGIKDINVTFDDETIHGCCVIRNKPLTISNIPRDNMFGIPAQRLLNNDNKIEIFHGGLWLLIKSKSLSPGDHLVRFKAKSINYDIEGKIQISALL
jgi:hypothetical protein